jgi:hypothetical protein
MRPEERNSNAQLTSLIPDCLRLRVLPPRTARRQPSNAQAMISTATIPLSITTFNSAPVSIDPIESRLSVHLRRFSESGW